ncbi:MAG: hypothetical protein ACTH93_05230 [Pseudoclavibacter sp.]
MKFTSGFALFMAAGLLAVMGVVIAAPVPAVAATSSGVQSSPRDAQVAAPGSVMVNGVNNSLGASDPISACTAAIIHGMVKSLGGNMVTFCENVQKASKSATDEAEIRTAAEKEYASIKKTAAGSNYGYDWETQKRIEEVRSTAVKEAGVTSVEELPDTKKTEIKTKTREIKKAAGSTWKPLSKVASVAGKAFTVLGLGQVGYYVADGAVQALGGGSATDFWCGLRRGWADAYMAVLGADCSGARAELDALGDLATLTQTIGDVTLRTDVVRNRGDGQIYDRRVCASNLGSEGWYYRVEFSDGKGYSFVIRRSTSPFCGSGASVVGRSWTGSKAWKHGASEPSEFTPAPTEVSEDTAGLKRGKTTVKCTSGHLYTAYGDTVENTTDASLPAEVEIPDDCEPASVSNGMDVSTDGGKSWTPTGTAGTDTAEFTSTLPSEYSARQECSDGSCALTIKKVNDDGTELDCFDHPSQCADWATETQAQPSRYKCVWGGQVLDLSECNVYRNTFKDNAVKAGNGYSDPDPTTDPSKKPTTDPENPTSIGTGPVTNPGSRVATDPHTNSGGATTTAAECFPNGWGVFNPVEWVLAPVKCSLKWAFVPDDLTGTLNGLRSQAVPGLSDLQVAATNWGALASQGSSAGCVGPTIKLNLMDAVEYQGNPLSACSGPMATAAEWSRTIITATMWLLVLTSVTRNFAAIWGYTGVSSGPIKD